MLSFCTFIALFNFQAANAATSTNVDKYLAAIKSAQPSKIEQARVKYVVPGSSADLFTKMVINHFNGTQYLKTLDKFGNVSPTAPDAPGKLTKKKDGVYVLDSTFNTIDGELKDFILNKSKKISDFKFKQVGSKYVTTKGNLQSLVINYNEGGTEIKSGIHWKLPNNNSFIQVNFKNNFGGFKSWSYARGYVRDASGVNHETITGPLGCTNTGGSTVIEATTNSAAVIVKNTTSTLIIPMYLSCTGDNLNEIKVPFLVQ
jgi:hypothetical protein